MTLSAKSAAQAASASSRRARKDSSQRVSATPDSAKPSMVREMIRKAKLLSSFAETRRWTSTWRNRVAAAVMKARPHARAVGLSGGSLRSGPCAAAI